ncbi:MAG TPA: hypothetical protein DD435_08935 [Cyanobacteria bacterium UBA8530]|nr:hypothetical protein [Cyanobacteria bacterium UBA8530]
MNQSVFYRISLILAFSMLAGCGTPLMNSRVLSNGGIDSCQANEEAGPLPDRVILRTGTESFTDEWYFAVRGGRIFVKPNEEKTGKKDSWQPLNGTGLPANRSDADFRPPTRIKEISAECYHLIAISETGAIYDTTPAKDGGWQSTGKWGKPFSKAFMLPENRGWSISVRGKGSTYTDLAGHVHTVGVGVTSLFILDKDGTTLHYGDPWLPDFSNTTYGPLRGRFISESFAASGSEVFVINKFGDMYTRLTDFDIDGHNPLYTFAFQYTFDPDSPDSKRFLPAAGWVSQPKIDGTITKQLTVVQTGLDTSDRELRVAGIDRQGKGGYWTKPLKGSSWRFVATGTKVKGPFLDNRPSDCSNLILGPSKDVDCTGTAKVNGAEFKAELLQYNPNCSPSTLRLALGGQTFDCTLHIRGVYLKSLILGTLELPDALLDSSDSTLRKLVKNGFGCKKWTSLQIEQKGGRVRLQNKHYNLGPVPILNPAGLAHPVDMDFKLP